MAEQLSQPGPLSLQGNLSENWRRWKQRFTIYLTATGKSTASNEVKAAIFLHLLGPDALYIFNTFKFDAAGDEKKVNKLIEKFEAYCTPRKNVTWERHVFNTRNQKPGETVDEYVTDLRIKAKTCEFGDLTEGLIRDRIVCGIISDKTRSRLLKKENLTLAGALDICHADEAAINQVKVLSTNASDDAAEDKEVQFVKRVPRRPTHPSPTDPTKSPQCGYCGGRHHPQQGCPAFGANCHKCGRRNHFAKVCRSKTQIKSPRVREVEQEDGSSEDDLVIDAVEGKNKTNWNVTITINSHNTKFKIDTGAQCNVISSATYHQVSHQPLRKSKSRLIAFGGQRLNSLGKTTILCTHKGKFWPIEFEVIDNVSNILGLETCTEMRLIKCVETLTNDTLKRYADTFNGLGCIDVTHHIEIDPNCKPVVHPPRRVPVTMRSKVKKELERMDRLDVIEKVQGPTDWVNSMVTVVKKNGQLRICIDPRDLNKAIKREHYPMRTVEEIAACMPDAKYFSVLDASSGFWQVKLDDESCKLCTFNTPFGRYMFKRLPFGICSAQDVFQTVMSEIFQDIDGVEVAYSYGEPARKTTTSD